MKKLMVLSLLVFTSQALFAKVADDIAATVNDDKIPMSEFYERLEQLRANDFFISINPVQVRNETGGQLVLNSLINEHLILQWADKTKQLPAESEIQTEYETIMKREDAKKAFADGSIKESALRYSLKVSKARFNLATTAVSLSPAEVQKYYKDHLSDYSTPEKWGLALIRVSTLAKAEAVQKDIKSGKAYGEIVKRFSEDPNAQKTEGIMDPISAKSNSLPPAMQAAVKGLKIGEVAGPIKLDFAGPKGSKVSQWFFIRLVSQEKESAKPFAEIQSQVEHQAMLARAGGYEVADKKISDFRKISKVKVTLLRYKSLEGEKIEKK